MSTQFVDHSPEFLKLLNNAAAEGIVRCTERYKELAKQTVGVSNPSRRMSAKEMRKQALKAFNGKRTAGLVTFTKTERKTGQVLKSTQWFDTSIDNNKTTASIYPFSSKPGEPPRKRTGMGQASIQSEFDRGIPAGRVGMRPQAKYMIYLNFGTKRIAARPWIEVTLKRNEAVLGLMLKIGARSVMGGP